MRIIKRGRSLTHFWSDLIFLEAALLANPETADLAAPITAHINDFARVRDLDMESRRAVIQSNARVRMGDSRLDEGLRDLQSDTLAHVRQDRSAREHRTLFPERFSDMLRHALRRQLEVVRSVVERLQTSVIPAELRDAHTPRLTALVEDAEGVLAERRAHHQQRLEANFEIEDWKDEANALRLAVHGELTTLAARNHRTRSWAEEFFASRASTRVDDTPEAASDDASPPTPEDDPAPE